MIYWRNAKESSVTGPSRKKGREARDEVKGQSTQDHRRFHKNFELYTFVYEEAIGEFWTMN